MQIRLAARDDLPEVLRVEREAFGGTEEAALVEALLVDPTATPTISFIAEDSGRVVGHVLLSRAVIEGAEERLVLILAPLAVAPEAQRRGVGGELVRRALAEARDVGAVAVLLLGHIAYYPRFGFEPAQPYGLVAPHPIPDEVADAWMVAELVPGTLGTLSGEVRVAESMMGAEYWRE